MPRQVLSSSPPPPVLAGLQISLTGIDFEHRPLYKHEIEQLGGVYSSQLTKRTTHLIASAAEGRKYKAALQWAIVVVSPVWLADCVEHLALMDPARYPVMPLVDRPVSLIQVLKQDKSPQTYIVPVAHLLPPAAEQSDEDDRTSFDTSMTILYPNLFLGVGFACDGFTQSQVAILKHEIQQHSGSFITENFPKTPAARVGHSDIRQWMLIVPFESTPYDTRHKWGVGTVVVTEFWLEQALNEGILIDPHSDMLYEPLGTLPNVNGASKLSLCISGYEGLEREHIVKLAELMGFPFTASLTRKNTHLICKHPDGAKYKKALDWGILVIDKKWLYIIAQKGYIQLCDQYLVGRTPQQTPLKPPSKRKLDTIEVKSVKKSTPDFKNLQTIDSAVPKSLKTSFSDLNDLQTTDSIVPPTKTTSELPTTPIVDTVPTPCLDNTINDELLDGTTGLAHQFHQNMMNISDLPLLGTPRIPATSQTSYSKHSSCNRKLMGILNGVIVCLSSKLPSHRNELRAVAKELGAECLNTYSDTCTHFVHQSVRNTESFRDFKRAKASGKFIVSPWWLYQCQETGQRLFEDAFPHIFNPAKWLSLSNNSINKPEAQFEFPDAFYPSSTTTVALLPTPNVSISTLSIDTSNSVQPYPTSLVTTSSSLPPPSSTMDTTSTQNKRRKLTNPMSDETSTIFLENNSSLQHDKLETLSNVLETVITQASKPSKSRKLRVGRTLDQIRPNPLIESPTHPSSSNDTKMAGMFGIAYGDDPKLVQSYTTSDVGILTQQQRDRRQPPLFQLTIDQLSRSTSMASGELNPLEDKQQDIGLIVPGQTVPSASTELGVINVCVPRSIPTLEPSSLRKHSPYIFLLSAMTEQQKTFYAMNIRDLGASVVLSDGWQQGCTHVVIGRPNKSEKYLAAIAAGAWIVRLSYLDATIAAKDFVAEEPHEWGSVTADFQLVPHTELVEAPRKWRMHLHASGRRGAFEGWTVYLMVEESRVEGYTRLLVAGGAVVHTSSSLVQQAAHNTLTHVFVTQRFADATLLRTITVTNTHVLCLLAGYIADYLFKCGDGVSKKQWTFSVER